MQRTSLPSLCLAVLVLSAAGCGPAEEDDDAPGPALRAQDAPPPPDLDAGAIAPSLDGSLASDAREGAAREGRDGGRSLDPRAPYLASITANGAGCPPGSWDALIAPDGSHLDVNFAEYEVVLGAAARSAYKDCILTLKLRSPVEIAIALSDLYYQGYAALEAGVRGFPIAQSYVQGAPVPAATARTNLTGPLDRSFQVHEILDAGATGAFCGLEHTLQIVTRLGLQTSRDAGTGSISLDTLRIPAIRARPCR